MLAITSLPPVASWNVPWAVARIEPGVMSLTSARATPSVAAR